jgi:hypothetical protein
MREPISVKDEIHGPDVAVVASECEARSFATLASMATALRYSCWSAAAIEIRGRAPLSVNHGTSIPNHQTNSQTKH